MRKTRYTVTVEKEGNISPETSLAIGKFKELKKAQDKADRLEGELGYWIAQVPKEDMNIYVEITEEINKE